MRAARYFVAALLSFVFATASCAEEVSYNPIPKDWRAACYEKSAETAEAFAEMAEKAAREAREYAARSRREAEIIRSEKDMSLNEKLKSWATYLLRKREMEQAKKQAEEAAEKLAREQAELERKELEAAQRAETAREIVAKGLRSGAPVAVTMALENESGAWTLGAALHDPHAIPMPAGEFRPQFALSRDVVLLDLIKIERELDELLKGNPVDADQPLTLLKGDWEKEFARFARSVKNQGSSVGETITPEEREVIEEIVAAQLEALAGKQACFAFVEQKSKAVQRFVFCDTDGSSWERVMLDPKFAPVRTTRLERWLSRLSGSVKNFDAPCVEYASRVHVLELHPRTDLAARSRSEHKPVRSLFVDELMAELKKEIKK